ncbi:MAG: alpha/beta hydrolase [Proteobacteria bacterium]|nr:alpha/beta hydrolase [Pseudomonadota bacterium]
MQAALAAGGLAGLGLAGLAFGAARNRIVEGRNPPTGRFVDVHGVRLHVLQSGSGPDILLIHGVAMSAAEQMTGLSGVLGGYRLTAPDRPGHGWSPADLQAGSPFEQARKLKAVADALGLVRPTVVGHSLGGAVALAYGMEFAAETSGVVLLAPLAYPGLGTGHLKRAFRAAPGLGAAYTHGPAALFDPLQMRAYLRLIFAPQKPTPEFKRNVPFALASRPVSMRSDSVDFTATALALQAMQARYTDYPAPVHLVVSLKDKILKPKKHGLRLAEVLPDVRVTTVPGQGHMGHHFSPELVRAAVDEVRARAGAPAEQALAA